MLGVSEDLLRPQDCASEMAGIKNIMITTSNPTVLIFELVFMIFEFYGFENILGFMNYLI